VLAGAVNFLGGIVGLTAYLRGGVMVDLGFPWLDDQKVRRWDRGFGFSVGIFVGHAGLYFKYQTGATATGKELTLAGGFGVAVGYGFCVSFGVVTVYASIEVYAILEGSVTVAWALPAAPSAGLVPTGGAFELTRFQLRGVIGLVARGYAEIDVWVLYARVEVIVFAEAEAMLGWAKGEKAHLDYAFRVGQQFSASCRVGVGFFSFTFSFSIAVVLEFKGRIDL
jgi:hypothetical protein